MPRYIDAELIDLDRVSDSICQWQAQEAIDDTPTADVVPVVRCKDCIHHKDAPRTLYVWCECVDGLLPKDWFCADGERETDDGET